MVQLWLKKVARSDTIKLYKGKKINYRTLRKKINICWSCIYNFKAYSEKVEESWNGYIRNIPSTFYVEKTRELIKDKI